MTREPGPARPPRLARLLLRIVLHPDDRECALSDLSEEFEARHAEQGGRAARRWYRQQARSSIRPAVGRRLEFGLLREMRWAWRGIRGRGWRAAMIVLLFGVALAANAVVFAAADAFVFRTLPYHASGQLAIIEKVSSAGLGVSDYVWPLTIPEWRRHRDLLADVQAHVAGGSAYLTSNGITETVRSEQVTPGLFALLGVMPVWGRPLTDQDAAAGQAPVAIIGEALARRLFTEPAAAVGRTFFTGRETLTVVGVMPASFRFPTAREEFWRPLDLATWPANSGVRDVVRLAHGQNMTTAAAAVADREAAVRLAAGRPSNRETLRLRSMAVVRGNANATTVFAILVAAGACLLLIACANVVSLEVAAAAGRMRVYAIQAALGASRSSLFRVGLFEGAALLGASAVVAIVLTMWGTRLLDSELTVAMRDALTNPLDVDFRALAFMLAIATLAWMLTSLPAIARISRLSVVDGLRDDPRTMPVTRAAARSRQILMAGQVALTTLLLVGAILLLRTYMARVGMDKGFDSSNIATIQVSRAPDAPVSEADLEAAILAKLKTAPGVLSASRTDSLVPSTQSGITARLTIDTREPTTERVMLHFADVDPEYFETMQIGIVQGRAFDAATPRDQVMIDERFARKYWPDGSPLGSRFRMQGAGMAGISDFQVAGVSRQLRADRLETLEGNDVYVGYIRISPTYHPLAFVARMDDERRLRELDAMLRGLAPRSVVRVDTVSARYARLAGDTRLAAAITTGFGVIALLIATSGIYAVMAFLVSGRSKEIAIRMALGADRRSVRALVLRSSLRFVGVGMLAGLLAAVVASRWLAAQLFGVTATDPLSYSVVSALIVATALAATWWPARRAARVDPAVTLRAQ